MEIILSIAAGLAVLRLTFSWFWDGRDDFVDAVKMWFTPDIIDAFRGRWFESHWAELKIFFWLLLGIAAGYCVHAFLTS